MRVSAALSRQPSMMLAWFSRSLKIRSPLPASVHATATLADVQELKRSAASVAWKRASVSHNSSCSGVVASGGFSVEPLPYCRAAAHDRSITSESPASPR